MPAPTRLVSRAAVADVYEDVADVVRETAFRFASRYDRDPEETLADACVYFLEALHGYDPSKGALRPRLAFIIWNRLHDARRRDIHIWEQFRGFGLNALKKSGNTDTRRGGFERGVRPAPAARSAPRWGYDAAPPEPAPFDRDEFESGLGDDARVVMRLLLDTPPDLADAIRSDPDPGPGSIGRHVRRYLCDVMGWTARRASVAFRQIRWALR